jgi:large subunit ribosomal protein L4
MRSFEVKVNRKAAKAALRSALTSHATEGSIAVLDASGFETPSTKVAAALVEAWGVQLPLLVVTTEDEEGVIKSFRNLPKVLITIPAELEVSAVVWAQSLLVTEAALEQVVGRAQTGREQ